MNKRLLCLFIGAFLAGSACASGEPDAAAEVSPGPRPSSSATLAIVEPAAGAVVTGPELTVKMELEGGFILPEPTTKLRPDQGHIHLTLDGELQAMSFGLEHRATVTPGNHLLQAEFVAGDHAPFNPRVIVVKSFEAK